MNYLYNGVELPALPEDWDRETYPCGVITTASYGRILFSVKESFVGWEIRVDEDYDPDRYYAVIRTNSGTKLQWVVDDGKWVFYRTYSDSDKIQISSEVTDRDLVVPNDRLVWTNTDIVSIETGELLLAASDPIPVSSFTPDPISMTMGWLVGRRIAGQRGKRTPIAYLYNGVRLPDINTVWTDKEKYPYAFLRNDTTVPQYDLFLSDVTPDLFMDSSNIFKINGPWYRLTYSGLQSGESWSIYSSVSNANVGNDAGWPVFWGSVTVSRKDGTVVVPSPDPVPVYES